MHKEIQAPDATYGLSRNKRFLGYDAVGLRGDAHAGVASGGAAAFLKSVRASVQPLPLSGAGLLQSKSVAEFKPIDVIMSSRKLQGALKMKEVLKFLPTPAHDPGLDGIPSFPLQIRSESQVEEANRGHASRRFTVKMRRAAEFREKMADMADKYSPKAVNARVNPDLPAP